METKLLSVGIDVGTSTTVVVFSELHVIDASGNGSLPRAQIVDKEVIYRSPVYFTPLLSDTEINVDEISDIIVREYRKAGILPSSVQTGAVIVTGDTARKKNADLLLHEIAHLAGDFVVATAGPELESILAGKGSGAEEYSINHSKSITNIDIGGGTSNYATFYDGQPIDADCLDIGGRLIRFTPGTRRIEFIFPKIAELAAEIGVRANVGTEMAPEEIMKITDKMAEALFGKFEGETSSFFEKACTRTDVPHNRIRTDVITFSGGVGDLVYSDHLPNDFAYNDIGVFLAKSVKRKIQQSSITVQEPSETIGATVVGAGSHSVSLSGSTVCADPLELPQKNLPVFRLAGVDRLSVGEFCEKLNDGIRWIQGNENVQNVAIALEWEKALHYEDLLELTDKVIAGTSDLLKNQTVLVIVLRDNYAKALGSFLRSRLEKDGKRVICIDDVEVKNGDYIDIGKPIAERTEALPVVIKTLAFAY